MYIHHFLIFLIWKPTVLTVGGFTHFLLKYRYDRNWSREVKENYLPLSAEDIISHLGDNYEIIYKEQFILPFIHNQVMKDFGINIKDNTHIKIIARKKSEKK